ncbi:MAG: carboxypeptidase regulatory-like domain-containing protein [Terracidiphilus sp.]
MRKSGSLERRKGIQVSALMAVLALAFSLVLLALPAAAQTAGEGSIEGTVTDSTGAVVPHATVTVTNVATGVAIIRESTSAGFFSISPLLPGTYTVQISAKGFKTLVQDNVVVDALQTRTIGPVLAIGIETQTVTVTGAPPVLDTADATIQLTMENTTYTNLPIQMNNAQRDPTAFGALTPGAQAGSRLPVIGGTGNYLGQLYLDGMPAETVSQQGDNRLVSLSMSVDAVDQFQVLSSTPPAEYMGAGAENFTMKSGGQQYHGQASDFVRNTAFDAWSFTNKWATIKNALGQTIPAPKPPEHQNELSLSVGGVVPHTAKKLFFFVAYDKFHDRYVQQPSLYTMPTTLEAQGNFTELNGAIGTGLTGTGSNNPAIIYDPATTACTGSVCTRQPFEYNGSYNVIPPGDISPIAKAMESFLPTPTNTSVLVNNYLSGSPKGYDNHLIDYRVDYDLSSNHRISAVGTIGVENYLNNYSAPYIPLPYTGGDLANIYPKNFIVEDAYTITPNVINQLKYGFTRFFQNIHDTTQGISKYDIGTFGVTNLPAGQAGDEFPGISFGTTSYFGTALQTWTGNGNSVATQLTTPNNYALTDNLLWVKGKQAFTFGMTFQWQEINNANPATYTGMLQLMFNAFSTANFAAGASSLNTGGSTAPGTPTGPSGYSYASFLLGAVGGSTSNDTTAPSLGLDPVSELAGRYKVISPYVQDSYKITRKLTLDLGLRWDYLPPFHELKDRWTFLNPTLNNPLTNSPGLLQFAGSYGGAGVSCGCTTPVHTYFKNWGPRVGVAYEIDSKTVVRAGYAQVFSQGGGVGGRGGAYNGTGQTGFNTSIIGTTESGIGAAAGPSYWLNNNSAYLGSLANTALFGPTAAYPSAPTPGVAAQELNTGFYLNSSGNFVSASSVSYADPYYSGRAPEFELYNFGVERGLTPNLTLAVNYVGNESHFLINSTNTGTGNARGYWTNQVDPKYLAALGPLTDSTGKTPLLDAQATPANVALVQAAVAGAPAPAFYTAAGAASSKATIAQMLTPFPQYSGVSDTFGNVGNFSFNSLQITLNQRMSHGLALNANYTFSKNLGDDGPYRDGYNIPASAISHATTSFKQDRIDRSWTTLSAPNTLHVYGVYQLPFGKGGIGANNTLVRWLAGGWQFSGIYQFNQGSPLQITWSGCTATNCPAQGQNMPDEASGYTGHARTNGSYGKGPNGYQFASLGKVQYVDPTAFATPQNVSSISTAQYLIGNAPRTAPYGVRNPNSWDLDTGLRRSFPLHWESAEFVFEADCLNTWNNVLFSNPTATWSSGSTSFGTVNGIGNNPRDWQFAGHINF